jgi:hypothetical protein
MFIESSEMQHIHCAPESAGSPHGASVYEEFAEDGRKFVLGLDLRVRALAPAWARPVRQPENGECVR